MTILVNDVDDVIIFADVRTSAINDVTTSYIVKSYKYPPKTYFDQIGAPQLNLNGKYSPRVIMTPQSCEASKSPVWVGLSVYPSFKV